MKSLSRAFKFGIMKYNPGHTEFYKSMDSYFTNDSGDYNYPTAFAFYSFNGNAQTNLPDQDYSSAYADVECNKNDVLTMTLDLSGENGILSYKWNDKDLGVAFDIIDVNQQYCMVVCVYHNDTFRLTSER